MVQALHRRSIIDNQAILDRFAPLVDVHYRLGDVFHVAVRVGPAVDGQPVKLQLGHDQFSRLFILGRESQGSEPDAAYCPFPVDFDG